MSVKDIIKNSFLQEYQVNTLTVKMMLLYIAAAAFIGIFIFLVYRLMTRNMFYSKTFNIALMLLCVITTAIILTIQNSIVVSLGMVGALSIVRFRTAIKEPLDLVFLFWSISAGIITGARMVGLSIVLSVVVTVLMVCFHYIPEERKSMLIAVKTSEPSLSSTVTEIVKKYDKKYHLKSKVLTKAGMDIIFETRMRDYETVMEELNSIKEVSSVSLIAHKGETLY